MKILSFIPRLRLPQILPRRHLDWCLVVILLLAQITHHAHSQGASSGVADYIVAIVNNEVITEAEVQQRIHQFSETAKRSGEKVPETSQLRHQILESLIEERAMLSLARETGIKIEEHETQRAINYLASQNQISITELRNRVTQDGMDYKRFIANIQDQMLVERYRDREVTRRIEVSEADIDSYIQKLQGNKPPSPEMQFNLGQILIAVPENATPTEIKKIQTKAQNVLNKAREGVNFANLVGQFSDDKLLPSSGEMGLKPSDQIPDTFLSHIKKLESGQVSPELIRSGAGFHILKLIDRRESTTIPIPQTQVKHILIRTPDTTKRQAAVQSLTQMRGQIIRRNRTFESFAREYSEDGSAANGGDLGWAGPGMFVPEFEQAMNKLPKGGISGPVISRFGVHLIQVIDRRFQAIERKEVREKAQAYLRQEKYDQTYRDWLKEIRNRVYLELRESPES